MNNEKVNIQLFLSRLVNESRLYKETKSVIDTSSADKVIVYGLWVAGLEEIGLLSDRVQYFRIKTLTSILQSKGWLQRRSIFRKVLALVGLIEYHIKVIAKCAVVKPHSVSCHNLELLPLAVLVKFICRTKVVYTPHELETERTGKGKYQKIIGKLTERTLIKFTDSVIVVSDPIRDWYISSYQIERIYTIPNKPENLRLENPDIAKEQPLRAKFDIPAEDIVFLYQGLLDGTRGVDTLLRIFAELRADCSTHLVLMGYGEMEEQVRQFSENYKNIFYQPAVPVDEIIKYTASCDVGVFFVPTALSLSYTYSLPNKYYEYLIAGLPILVSRNLKYLTGQVEEHSIGWALNPNVDELKNFVENISSELIKPKKAKVAELSNIVGWHENLKLLEDAYRFPQ